MRWGRGWGRAVTRPTAYRARLPRNEEGGVHTAVGSPSLKTAVHKVPVVFWMARFPGGARRATNCRSRDLVVGRSPLWCRRPNRRASVEHDARQVALESA